MSTLQNDFHLTPTEEAAVRGVVARALDASHDADRTGIAAAIVSGDSIVEIAENEVNLQGDPTQHAEMVLISRVTQSMNRKQLSVCTLISSLQPCEMCLSAMRFAGLSWLEALPPPAAAVTALMPFETASFEMMTPSTT